MRKLPNHISGTHRAWKVRKRRELKALVKAFETLQLGIMFTPAYKNENWSKLNALLDTICEEMSYKKWGR